MTIRNVAVGALVVALLGLAACGYVSGAGTGGAAGATVTVTLSDFKIASSQTSFSVGQPYHFVVTNSGATAHEFTIMPPLMDDMGNQGNMDQMHLAALAVVDNIAPGQSAAVNLTFASSAATAPLEIACHVGSHYQLGMREPIMVNAR